MTCRDDRPNSLDLLREVNATLESLFREWDGSSAMNRSPDATVTDAAKRGSIGKLIIESGAIRLAAKEDVLEALRRVGTGPLAEHFGDRLEEARAAVGRLNREARGVTAIDLRYSSAFDQEVATLRGFWRGELQSEREYLLGRVRAELGPAQCRLRSARYITTHALRGAGSRRRLSGWLPAPLGRAALFARALLEYLHAFPPPEHELTERMDGPAKNSLTLHG